MKKSIFKSALTRLLILTALAVAVFSCTSSKTATPGASQTSAESRSLRSGEYGLELAPGDPDRNSVLTLTVKGFPLSAAKLTWLVNGAIDPDATSEQFQASRTARGDTIQAKALFSGAEVLSNIVTIRNTAPSVTAVRFVPDVFRPGDKLGVEATGTDPDGDDVTLAYEWTVNGELAGNGQRLNRDLKRGDTVSVRITPYDGRDYGVASVVERKIENMPPVITEHRDFSFDGSVYTYQVKASDPDGDNLQYSLSSPIEGMTIDPATGLLRWTVPPDFKGKKDVTVTVSDGHGGTSSYTLDITIQ